MRETSIGQYTCLNHIGEDIEALKEELENRIAMALDQMCDKIKQHLVY